MCGTDITIECFEVILNTPRRRMSEGIDFQQVAEYAETVDFNTTENAVANANQNRQIPRLSCLVRGQTETLMLPVRQWKEVDLGAGFAFSSLHAQLVRSLPYV